MSIRNRRPGTAPVNSQHRSPERTRCGQRRQRARQSISWGVSPSIEQTGRAQPERDDADCRTSSGWINPKRTASRSVKRSPRATTSSTVYTPRTSVPARTGTTSDDQGAESMRSRGLPLEARADLVGRAQQGRIHSRKAKSAVGAPPVSWPPLRSSPCPCKAKP